MRRYEVMFALDRWYVYEMPQRCKSCGHMSSIMTRVFTEENNKGFETEAEAQAVADRMEEDAR